MQPNFVKNEAYLSLAKILAKIAKNYRMVKNVACKP